MEQDTRVTKPNLVNARIEPAVRLLRNQVFSMLLILILIWIVLALLSPYFFTVTNLFEITLQSAVFAIIAAGETFVIFSGGIDLSVGSVFAFSAIVGGIFFRATGSVILATLTSLATGMAAGIVNGLFISLLRVPPFVATLGMMGIARGLALIAVNGIPIYGLSKDYMWIGQGRVAGLIPVPTIVVAAIFVLAYLVLNYTRFGRFTYAIGSNRESARLSGVNVAGVTLGIYAVAGMLSALAGIIESARLGTVQPAGGDGYELLAIGAVVIGGTSLFGGEGNIIGTLIGALLVTTIRNGLNILGVYAFWQYVVNGLIIILAVAVDQVRRRR
jgi:ribose transport system permease protein